MQLGVRVTHLRVKYFIPLELKDKLFDSQFAEGQIKPTAGVQHYKQKNQIIAKRLSEAHDLLLDWDRKKIPFSIDRFKDQFAQKKSQDYVIAFLDQLVAKYASDKKPGTSGVYKTLKNSIFKFQKSKQLRFSDITLSFLQRYTSYLFKEGLTGNGISLYMRTLRSAYNKAIALGVADLALYPFHNLQNPNGYKISELEQITYTRAKTRNRKIFTMAILEPVQTIIDYFALHPLKSKNYLLPILDDEKHPTEKQKKTRVQSLLKKVNRDLKTLGTDAKIKTPVTTYVARHSWATIMKTKGTATAVISEAMGHPDEKTTQIYLEDFENSVLDDANRKLLE